jgi:hypothetical protein
MIISSETIVDMLCGVPPSLLLVSLVILVRDRSEVICGT